MIITDMTIYVCNEMSDEHFGRYCKVVGDENVNNPDYFGDNDVTIVYDDGSEVVRKQRRFERDHELMNEDPYYIPQYDPRGKEALKDHLDKMRDNAITAIRALQFYEDNDNYLGEPSAIQQDEGDTAQEALQQILKGMRR